MQVNELYKIFCSLPKSDDWNLKLLKWSSSKENINYYTKDIYISKGDETDSLIKDITKNYVDFDKEKFKDFEDIVEYNGAVLENTIYSFNSSNELISDAFKKLTNAFCDSKNKKDPFEFQANGYVFCGKISVDNETKSIELISIKKPVSNLKYKYAWDKGNKFKAIPDKVLSLNKNIDVIIYDNNIYLLTLDGEKLFNLESAAKKKSQETIKSIKKYNIFSNYDSFSKVANEGFNPRRFLSFNEETIKALEDDSTRVNMAKSFNINLKEGNFDTDDKINCEKIIKLICDRAMFDPINNTAREVSGAKKWN